MTPFTTVRGAAASIPSDNIDTDVIIRIERLTAASTRQELGRYALEALRLRADGSEETSFVLNQAPFRQAPILITGRNFGCGSSREGAVWALHARGIRCVIGESFGDIFYANCFQNGLLPIRLPASAVEGIRQQAKSGVPVEVNLLQQRVHLPEGADVSFDIDPIRREALLEGLDDIGQTLKRIASISAWQATDRRARPWMWPSDATSVENA